MDSRSRAIGQIRAAPDCERGDCSKESVLQDSGAIKELPPGLIFVVFCLLLAGRDAFSHFLLVQAVDPVFMLTVYCISASVVAWVFRMVRTRSIEFRSAFRRLTGEQKLTFVKLGLATWTVYAVTVFGIKALGATVFNAVDYGSMPILTLFAGIIMFRERLAWYQGVGAAISMLGIALFLTAPSEILLSSSWRLWILVALLSPIFTSLSSGYQKRQIDQGLHPDEVLLFRFPLPALLMIVWMLIEQPEVSWTSVPALAAISIGGLFLPLWLLCFAFMKSSLSRFSMFLFLVPIFTFVLGPLLVEGEWEKLTSWPILGGILVVLTGYASFSRFWRPTPERSDSQG